MVECRVSKMGRLRQCHVLSETPTGANVGAFALSLAAGYRLDPQDRRIKDNRIVLPMQFKLPQAR